ncbi:MAG: class I SAM-dependent methyltransferase, partial [Chloroflexota bacterium]
MPSNYDILAEIHDEIGIGDFAERMTSRLLDYAQRNDWMGRQIAVLGSGSSESIRWLAQHSYVVTGVEQSQRMLELTQSALDTAGVSAQLILADFRAVTFLPHDMVLSLDTLSELSNIRDLERVLKHIHGLVKAQGLFIFDMYTIEGLVKRNQDGYALEHDADGLTIFAGNDIDYERSIQYRKYIIFREQG